MLSEAYRILWIGALIVLILLIGIMLVRAVIGPRITDRILSINMIGTMVIACILILSRLLNESYLLDVAIIYAMISFVAVLMLAATYIPTHNARKREGGAAEKKQGKKKSGRRAKRHG